MTSVRNLQTSISNLNDDLAPLKTYHSAKIFVTHNNNSAAPKLAVYCSAAHHAYVPKKYDGFEILIKSWDGNGTPWMDEFFEDLMSDMHYIAGWY